MKKIMSIMLLGLSLSTFAEKPVEFSAFTKGDNLYVTILGDSCNNYEASLEVAKSCDSRRLTRNFAVSCRANLEVAMTQLYCGNSNVDTPRVMTLSLKDNYVSKEVQTLYLSYGETTIAVAVDQFQADAEPNADYSAEEIYKALDTNAIIEGNESIKSVGGLICTSEYSYGGSTYKCNLRTNNNSEQIYNALKVKAKLLSGGRAGAYAMSKKVGGLDCVKSGVVYVNAKPQFTCTLTK